MQKFGGVSNVFTQLMLNMPKEIECKLALLESDNIHLKESGLMNVYPLADSYDDFLGGLSFRGKGRLYNMWTQIAPSQTSKGRNVMSSIAEIKRGDFDIFHPTFFDDYFLNYLNGKPYVLTIHDMIAEKYLPSNDMQIVNKRKMVKSAAHIVAVSEHTKQDIIDMLGVDPHKISVIPLAVPDFETTIDKPIINEKYILFVGHRDSYKNFKPMVEAIAPIMKLHQDIKLVCTGLPFDKKELRFLSALDLVRQTIHLCVSDKELRNLYKYALCFVFPSEYEGFGIPILEAYQQNCPVLLNKRSCFPEVAHDAAIYFNLDRNGSDLTKVMDEFLRMSLEDINNLLKRQRKRLCDFSWKKSAGQLANVYRLVLDQI